MTITAFWPLLVALVGVIAYLVSTSPKGQELGRLAYFAGLLAFLLANAGRVVHLP